MTEVSAVSIDNKKLTVIFYLRPVGKLVHTSPKRDRLRFFLFQPAEGEGWETTHSFLFLGIALDHLLTCPQKRTEECRYPSQSLKKAQHYSPLSSMGASLVLYRQPCAHHSCSIPQCNHFNPEVLTAMPIHLDPQPPPKSPILGGTSIIRQSLVQPDFNSSPSLPSLEGARIKAGKDPKKEQG